MSLKVVQKICPPPLSPSPSVQICHCPWSTAGLGLVYAGCVPWTVPGSPAGWRTGSAFLTPNQVISVRRSVMHRLTFLCGSVRF